MHISLKRQRLRAAVCNVRAHKVHRATGRVAADEVQRPVLPEQRTYVLRQRIQRRTRIVQYRREILTGPAPDLFRLVIHEKKCFARVHRARARRAQTGFTP